MKQQLAVAVYLIVMIATIVTVDVAFLRDRGALRLLTNVGIVLAFGLFYVFVLKRFAD